jgi:hypothetical protein
LDIGAGKGDAVWVLEDDVDEVLRDVLEDDAVEVLMAVLEEVLRAVLEDDADELLDEVLEGVSVSREDAIGGYVV